MATTQPPASNAQISLSQLATDCRVEALDPGQEKFNSRSVAPTFFRNEPYGENVEGLSYCGDKSCAVERAVQTHDFEDSTLGVVIGGKPLLAKRFR
jgi:hypothetical protein